jgi:hypothetical protein
VTFVQRQLEVTIALGPPLSGGAAPTFNESPGNNTVTLSGLRMSAHIEHGGGPSDGRLELSIYGMTKSQMAQLATFGIKLNLVSTNSIVLTAGDATSGLSTVFVGFMLAAEADFNAQPDVAFHITAHCATPQTVVPKPVSSFKGTADVANIMSSLAAVMGLRFENNGIATKLSNPYFKGSAVAQMRACAKAAGINANIINGTLCIWPKNGARNSGTMPLISSSTGMIGYPTFTALGVNVRSVYNPSVGFGQKIQVESSLTPACGTFTVYGLSYDLECNVPNGKWEMLINGYNPRVPKVIIPPV